ncbi:MAG TPA: DNA polymerase ligase N-terminal domain-containing protein [Solirubrobacteraceae bacterium]|nr:DNA polymerase ligase N-terminal domain-containing protein [Solirubrobacteraceae bacterium]
MPRFVVQQHDATTLHYDFRLEHDGVLRSWAVPKGPSMDPAHKRLAIPVEDHSLAYGGFEGLVGMGGGSGAVIVWDRGEYELLNGTPDDDRFTFALHGEKLRGGFALTRTGPKQWLLVKKADEEARRGSDVTAERPESVKTGRTWRDVAEGGRRQDASRRGGGLIDPSPSP